MPPTSYMPPPPRLQVPPTPVPSTSPLPGPAGPHTPPHITYFNAPEQPPRRSEVAVQMAWTDAINKLMSPDGPEVSGRPPGWRVPKPLSAAEGLIFLGFWQDHEQGTV